MSAPSTSGLLVELPSRVIYVSMVAFPFFFTFDQFQRIDRFINWSGIYSLSFFPIFQKRDLEANNLKTIAHGTFRPFGGLTRM